MSREENDNDTKPDADARELLARAASSQNEAVSFSDIVSMIDDGNFTVDLGDELVAGFARLRALSQEQGNATGVLNLKFAFEVSPNGEVLISVKKDLRVPTRNVAVTKVWLSKHDRLSATDPKQMKLFGARRTAAREPRKE